MQKLPSVSTGTTDRLEIAAPATKLPFDLVCGPACSAEHLWAACWEGAEVSVVAALLKKKLEPEGAPVLTRVMLPAVTGAAPLSRVSSLRDGCVGMNSLPPVLGGAK